MPPTDCEVRKLRSLRNWDNLPLDEVFLTVGVKATIESLLPEVEIMYVGEI
jgi:hypothetical protein